MAGSALGSSVGNKKKKIKDIDEFNGVGIYGTAYGSTGGKKTGGASVPTYEPYQPKTTAYTEGTISAGEPAQTDYSANRVPMASLTTNEQRNQARQGYAFDMGDINRRILEAARAYGNAPQVTQFGLGEKGEDTSYNVDVAPDPNSAWENIGRYQTEYARNIDEDLNNRGSFFSGAHLERDQKLGDEVGRQRLAATTDWESSLADLMSAIARSRGARDDALRAADIQDALEALSRVTPQAPAPVGGGDVPVEALAPASLPAPAPGFYGFEGMVPQGNNWPTVTNNAGSGNAFLGMQLAPVKKPKKKK